MESSLLCRRPCHSRLTRSHYVPFILMIKSWPSTLWKMDYYYKVLSPQGSVDLALKDPQGQQREVKVDAKVQQLKRVLDLAPHALPCVLLRLPTVVPHVSLVTTHQCYNSFS
jgi:hypothetical protein